MSDFPIRIWVFTHKGTACKIRLADEESALALQSMIGASFESDWILEVVNPPPVTPALPTLGPPTIAGLQTPQSHSQALPQAQAHAIPQAHANVPPQTQVQPQTPPQPQVAQTAISGQNWSDRRKFPRISTQMKVIVVVGNQSMLSTTQDISEGGVRLAHSLGMELVDGQKVRIYLCHPDGKSKMMFHARVVDRVGEGKRLAFEGAEESSQSELTRLLQLAQSQKKQKAA